MRASVIVLAWNGIAFLPDCLRALTSQDFPDYEVIVVDNGSTDGSADFVAAQFPYIRLVRNGRNLGYAAGNNIGLRAATGDILVLLNQDTIVQSTWLRALSLAFVEHPSAGIIGGKALYPDGRIQHAGGIVDKQGNPKHLGYRLPDNGEFDIGCDVDYVTGAALAISRSGFMATGELDEGYAPAYFEDIDLCYRARANGFGVIYEPSAELTHAEESRVIDGSHDAMFRFHRNRLRFVIKHWPLPRLFDEFAPAERQWLNELGLHGEPLIAAMHHAYLFQLLRLDDLVEWRRRLYRVGPHEGEQLEALLLSLRTDIPLRTSDAGKYSKPKTCFEHVPTPAEAPAPVTGMHPPELPQLTMLSESTLSPTKLPRVTRHKSHVFRSYRPIFGPLITTIVRGLNHIATRWYVRPQFKLQENFNAQAVAALENMAQQLTLLSTQTQQQAMILSERDLCVVSHIATLCAQHAALRSAFDQRFADVQNQLESDWRLRLDAFQSDHRRLEEVLVEYLAENGRESAMLAREIRNLRTQFLDANAQ